ncbi:protein FAM161B [Micropterus salmoides]|uniref:protein FAM161B n=1 Tax=Micropterus salmoides TaxID=27706 RepID=UPI0018ECE4F0|nr:protein FAM161B [Micropterus salmoides]XP_038584618.1 protein FAM161B [Micropterus salmoides]
MSKLETMLEDGLRSELMLQQQLKTLSKNLRQQLQETERRQREELERRIHQNALLSTDVDRESGDKNEVNHLAEQVGMVRSTSTSPLTSDKETLHHPRQSDTPNSSSTVWVSPTYRTFTLTPARIQQCERFALSKTTQMSKEEEAEAECQKKFCALPAPSNVSQPLYQEMVELREKERKQGREQRRDFLLSIQKPFSFQEREKEKREKLIAMLNQVSNDQKNKAATVRKPRHKEVKDSSGSELKEQEICRQASTWTTVGYENPTVSVSSKLRTAERTRKEKLGFLDERPSFQPKIIHQVPDFSRLHKALQTEGLRKTQSKDVKDVIKCQPFFLRTSALPARQSRMSPENSQVPKRRNLSRSKSLGALTSLSTDTLPTYITDAVRKRCMAIRKSMEMRDSKNQETADWLRKYQMRSQAMKKTVTLHAKLLDPHSSLKEVYNEKLQHHREADQQRMREYTRELQDIKARVRERPYLFEQLKQKNAKAHAEQTYRNTLMKAGLKEQFVEENGEAVEAKSTSTSSEDNTDENDIQSREENVDDGEKIEDVEEKSVKSRGEEMP